ncbi:hypothetical protein V492_01659 [Pseudogymnoascus sp. VKM F-4246]|nr:hypothetical protein V492_01659 [Pseudogymnoascus sp. VKM F-4246]
MRIGCLQFAAQVGELEHNIALADGLLSLSSPQNLDLLVLPELAFTGYNFKSLHAIAPFLEPTTSGPSTDWARATAHKLNCTVVVGYPETVDVSAKWPTSPEYYNSAVAVSPSGATLANYRKSFLYYTDETWALEGPDGFFGGEFKGLGNVAMGICMDLNPDREHGVEYARRSRIVCAAPEGAGYGDAGVLGGEVGAAGEEGGGGGDYCGAGESHRRGGRCGVCGDEHGVGD